MPGSLTGVAGKVVYSAAFDLADLTRGAPAPA
jgi:hypothetical protein